MSTGRTSRPSARAKALSTRPRRRRARYRSVLRKPSASGLVTVALPQRPLLKQPPRLKRARSPSRARRSRLGQPIRPLPPMLKRMLRLLPRVRRRQPGLPRRPLMQRLPLRRLLAPQRRPHQLLPMLLQSAPQHHQPHRLLPPLRRWFPRPYQQSLRSPLRPRPAHRRPSFRPMLRVAQQRHL